MKSFPNMRTIYRSGNKVEEPFEKPVIVPELDDNNPANHAWADARFAIDIMSEHALFFALLMPEELASKERKKAFEFFNKFNDLSQRIDKMASEEIEVKVFVRDITEEIKPFIDYKAEQQEAQESGKLRSLVWPLFFAHTRHEAERWVNRLKNIESGNPEFDRKEVTKFWTNIMDEHARFVAHLLDPEEFKLIETAMKTSNVFKELEKGGAKGVLSATVKEPGTVIKSMTENPEIDAIMSAAETILDFKTKSARDIEKAHIKSIIDPRLADHVRREAVKFIEELKRSK